MVFQPFMSMGGAVTLIKYGFELDTGRGGEYGLFSLTLSLNGPHGPILWKPISGRETNEISGTLSFLDGTGSCSRDPKTTR